MSEMAEFYAARLDELEQIALAAAAELDGPDWTARGVPGEVWGTGNQPVFYGSDTTAAQAAHIALNDPAVLRQVEAGRKILAAYVTLDRVPETEAEMHYMNGLAHAVFALAAIDSDHPGYKPEWGS